MSERKKWTLDEWKKDKEEPEEIKKDVPPKVVGLLPDSPVNVSGVLPPGEEINIKSEMKDKNDHTALRHGRSRYEGFGVGHYIQTPPILFSRDGHNIFIGDTYRGATAFLILGGPSVNELNLDALRQPGILTMGVNNSVKTFRPNLWTCVDKPSHFMKSIWLDPTIIKFAPFSAAEKKIFDNESWNEMSMVVGQAPNVFYYRRNEHFVADRFLFEDTVNWGNHSNLCHCGFWRCKDGEKKVSVCPKCGEKSFGSRSVFLAAIRILYYLGVRNVFLLGCDFKMKVGEKNYSFEQERSSSSVSGNNNTYRMLKKRFTELQPIFKNYGFQIFNCNKNSSLDVFPKVSFADAVDAALYSMPDTLNERTEGLYDREAKLKQERKNK